MRGKKLKLSTNDNVSLVFITGIFMAIVNNLVYPFVNLFLLRIGGEGKHIALLSSLQGTFSIITILAVVIVLKYSSVKAISTTSLLLTRSFYVIFILVTFLPLEVQPICFVVLYGMKFIPNTFYNISSTSLWAEVLDNERQRAEVLSKRSILINITSLIVVMLTGLILNKLPKSHNELINYYKFFFVFAFIVGIGEYLQYKKFKINSENNLLLKFKGFKDKIFLEDVKADFVVLKEIVKKKNFRLFFALLLLVNMGWLIPMPLYPVYEFEVLKSNELLVSINTAVCLCVQAIGFMLWGKLVRKYNIYLLITICCFILTADLLIYCQLTSMVQVIIFNSINQINVAGFLYLPLLALYKEISGHDKIKNYFVSLYFIFTGLPQVYMPSITVLITNNFQNKQSFLLMASFRFIVALVVLVYWLNNSGYIHNNRFRKIMYRRTKKINKIEATM